MISSWILAITRVFDRLHHIWENPSIERVTGLILLWVYILTLVAVEMQRVGWYPYWLPRVPAGHFFSIQLAFTLILALEVISLIFILPASLSKSMGKQLEILTLILLRNAFKELALLPEPISVEFADIDQIIDIAVSGLGALCVFLCLGFFRKFMRRQDFLKNGGYLQQYIQSKKLVSLLLLIIFAGIAIRDLISFWYGGEPEFFETIYTILIFADICMVLIAQRYMPCYYAVFRNSGFVIGTLMMRLSLSAPPLLCSGIAVFASLYILALTWGTNHFMAPANTDGCKPEP